MVTASISGSAMNKHQKRSGILLHPTALPGPYGIGDLGPEAYKFIDNLSKMGQSIWQILPLGPTDPSFSPYSLMSTFAGNHLLISLELLVKNGLLSPEDISSLPILNNRRVEFDAVIRYKMPILNKVCGNFEKLASLEIWKSFNEFCNNNDYWLDDFSKFWTLKQENMEKSWIEWESEKINNPELVNNAKIIQFLFHDQWSRLQKYCRDRQISIIGDIPLYVSYDSADVWANNELFQLDESGNMQFQSGSPPCKYNDEGQIWENPLYDWAKHEEDNFKWMKLRFKKLLEMVDVARLDHFIGYKRYYRIPIDQSTAMQGEWLPGPGKILFQELLSKMQNIKVIAEDLGDITKDVIKLRDQFNFPGMQVLQFELDTVGFKSSYPENSVVYTGTHDNDTLRGWFNSLPERDPTGRILNQEKLLDSFNCSCDNIHWEIINYALRTSSNTVIIPLQDILGLDSAGRFNTPGTISDKNWTWRLEKGQLTEIYKNQMVDISITNKRKPSMMINQNKQSVMADEL